jgi:hypothetical protein
MAPAALLIDLVYNLALGQRKTRYYDVGHPFSRRFGVCREKASVSKFLPIFIGQRDHFIEEEPQVDTIEILETESLSLL